MNMNYIPVSHKLIGLSEIRNIIDVARKKWWTEGEYGLEFERRFGSYLGRKYVTLVNSGSSANLLALTALTSTTFGEKALKPGDEIITTALGFPTTVNPIFQNKLHPVFIDSDKGTMNPTKKAIRSAISKRTRGIMMAHTLGNPLDLDGIMEIVKAYGLWFIEDCCDALGSEYKGKLAGTFGHVSTYSFYPAHQITMGEGGAVVTDNPLIHRALRQFRDWGRDCWCATGKDNTCGKRFTWKFGDLPYGYDHKYVYSQIGYNLKLTDFQAAIGVAQMDRLQGFITKRRRNYVLLRKALSAYSDYFTFMDAEEGANPCWFGFMILLRDDVPFTRLEMVKYLESNGVGTRNLFAGNLLRHPAYKGRKDLKVVGKLMNADKIMNDGFWIGVWPGITRKEIRHMCDMIAAFIASKTS